MKIINLKLNETDDGYFLNIDLDRGDTILHIENILLSRKTLDDIDIKIENECRYGIYKSWISGLFSHVLRVYGDISIVQKAKEMTLEEIEKALGYPVKIVKENQ